ncbi:hypothetical protein SAMN05428997_1587 [Bosea sp. CRIB-10]|uniref:hypothetical protein n=1 Tax=Bosea sp. CRIB-10 TaxID=378404 RepID=UPI0008F229A1|nr:hypothetical protein [Bosea sp. CRIB-10]SFD78149.1 hypothetical protein SAMN05428997_1587 [Bosea sp. CRIB-10]
MLAAWALRNSKPLAGVGAALALLALAGLGFWRGVAVIERLQAQAAASARAERDAHWRAEIAAANALAERARAEQAQAVAAIEARAAGDARRLQTELNAMEAANAALAGGDRCGLERDRVRLLDGAR